jgi:exopolyphosphatase/guanosine-5'-triphosphate,3'-diphosphate pyrophosphatase
MLTFAAIDIGSNSCRLAIARVQQHKLKTLFEDREVTRLGESVIETGEISPEAMASTIKALKRFQKAVQLHVCDQVRVVATSAMRDARNSDAFCAWLKSTTGWTVEVISGLEEGRLIHLGVSTLEPGGKEKCLLIDLGGGSCEVTVSEAGRIREMVSLPLGAVRLQQEFLRADPPGKEDIVRLRQFIERELARAQKKLGKPRVQHVIATSGTAAALAEASEALLDPAARRRLAQPSRGTPGKKGVILQADVVAVRKLADKLLKMTNAQRAAVPGIGPRRSEIIAGGAQVYARLLERLELKGFRYSPLGLRDGLLAQMLGDAEARTNAHRTLEAERREGVLELCKRYGVDPAKAEAVRTKALLLFDQLQRVHELPGEYRLWLEAAAMMQDVGKYMNHQGHHRHTQYIIANSETFGFSPQQRAIVSAVARYQGKSRPTTEDRVMRAVPIEEHTNVRRAVLLLRLANALNTNQTGKGGSAAMKVRVQVYPKRIALDLLPVRGHAELEAWALKKEAAYFREVFRREILVDVA